MVDLRGMRATKPKPLHDFFSAFWDGFAGPSKIAAVAFAFTFPFALAATLWFYSATAIQGPAGAYLARSGLDSESYVTREALRLGSVTAESPRLVFVGPSTIAQAFGDGRAISNGIVAATGENWDVAILTTPLQSPFDQLALIENALGNRTQVDPAVIIAVGVGIQRLGWTEERLNTYEQLGRIGLRSNWVDQEMTLMGVSPRLKLGNFLVDNYRFAISHGSKPLIRFAMLRPAERQFGQYAKDKPMPVASRPREAVSAQIKEGQNNIAHYFALHERLAERIKAYPGVHLVLLEEGLSPNFILDAGLTELERATSDKLATFAKRVGSEYWAVFAEAQLTGEDYYDDLHLMRGDSQKKVQTAFVKRFASYIEQRGVVASE